LSKSREGLWVIDSFRSNFLIWDSMQHKLTRELLEQYENDTIDSNLKVKKMDNKHLAYASITIQEADRECMKVAQADEDGQFVTEDPVLAFKIAKLLDEAPAIRHPITGKSVKYVLSKQSAEIPTAAEVAKILKEREATKKAS
jgi:hypothetical protein